MGRQLICASVKSRAPWSTVSVIEKGGLELDVDTERVFEPYVRWVTYSVPRPETGTSQCGSAYLCYGIGREEHFDLITYLATHPTVGDEIVGTGGVRKVRYGAMGRGKSGGLRVIYYFYDEDMPIYALLIYGKNERANLTPEQRKAVKAFATAIKALRKRK